MDYGFWYDVACYANGAWKGNFTEKEVAENAYEYLCEWEETKAKGKMTYNLTELVGLLKQDIDELDLIPEMDAMYLKRQLETWVEDIEEEVNAL